MADPVQFYSTQESTKNPAISDGIHTDGIDFELQTEVAFCVFIADAFNDLLQG
jgi:hypothetical protein